MVNVVSLNDPDDSARGNAVMALALITGDLEGYENTMAPLSSINRLRHLGKINKDRANLLFDSDA